jgi:hypothetical protein
MANKSIRDYYCALVSENVKIRLKHKANISRKYKNDQFVKCNQEDCQYVNSNVLPCPLGIEMFNLLSPV